MSDARALHPLAPFRPADLAGFDAEFFDAMADATAYALGVIRAGATGEDFPAAGLAKLSALLSPLVDGMATSVPVRASLLRAFVWEAVFTARDMLRDYPHMVREPGRALDA